MKKLILSMAILLIASFSVDAQSYTLSWDGEGLGDTVVFEGTPDAGLVFEGILKNNSSDLDTIKLVRRFIHLVRDAEHSFCWGSCYPPNYDSIFAPDGFVRLEAGQSSSEFDFNAHYNPNGVIGTTIVEYTFYNKNDESEHLTVVAKFVTSPDAIDENILRNVEVSDVFPNPASNYVNINYTFPNEVNTASVKIVNLLGSVVKEQNIEIQLNTARIDLSGLVGGVYFYSVAINNEIIKTKKLIVR